MKRLIDAFAMRYPGIKDVEHVYSYLVGSVDDATRKAYLERAFQLGKDFEARAPIPQARGPAQPEYRSDRSPASPPSRSWRWIPARACPSIELGLKPAGSLATTGH